MHLKIVVYLGMFALALVPIVVFVTPAKSALSFSGLFLDILGALLLVSGLLTQHMAGLRAAKGF
jgi:hypothetical protein